MINRIINQFKTDFEAISWVDKYGGLARPMTTKAEVSDGEFIELIYPVSCANATGNCFETGTYRELLPDPALKSVVYFIQDGAFIKSAENKYKLSKDIATNTFQCSLRLVVWLNLPLLGYKDQYCDAVSLFAAEMWRKLEAMRANNPTVRFEVQAQYPNDERVVFQEYLQGVIADRLGTFTLYPYGFFALSVNLIAELSPNCWADVPILPSNVC